QLLYQLSYAPGSRLPGHPQEASCSKVRWGCPANRPGSRDPYEKAAGNGPGGSWQRQSSGGKATAAAVRGSASAGVVGAALPVAAVTATIPAAHAQQHGETVLLALVEALVERLRGVGELLQTRRPRGHRVGTLAQAPDRIRAGPLRIVATARVAAGGHAVGPRLHALGAILGEIADRRLDRRPVLLLLGGELEPGLEARD